MSQFEEYEAGAGGGYGGGNRGTGLVRIGSNYSDLPVDSSINEDGNIILYDIVPGPNIFSKVLAYLQITRDEQEQIIDYKLLLIDINDILLQNKIFYSSTGYPYIFVIKPVFGIEGIEVMIFDPSTLNNTKANIRQDYGVFPFTYVYPIADAEGNLSQTPFGLVQLNGDDREVWQLDGLVKKELPDEFPRESLYYFNGSGYTSPVYEGATFDAATNTVNTGNAVVDDIINIDIIESAISQFLQSDEEEESLHGMAIHSPELNPQTLFQSIGEKITSDLDNALEQIQQTQQTDDASVETRSTAQSVQSIMSVKSIVSTIAQSLVEQKIQQIADQPASKPIGCTLECIDISCPVFPLLEIIKIIKSKVSLENKIKKIRSLVNKYALLKFCMKNKIYFGQPHPKMSNIVTGVLTYIIDEMLWMLNQNSVEDVLRKMSAGPISKESKREWRILVLYNLAQNQTTNKFAGYIYNLMSATSGNASSSFVGGNGPLTIILTLQNIKSCVLDGTGTLCETVYMVYKEYYNENYDKFIAEITEIANHIKLCMDTDRRFNEAFNNLQLLFSDYDNFVSILSNNKDIIDFCNQHLFKDLIMNWMFYVANAMFMLLRNKLSYQMLRDSKLFRDLKIDFNLINSAAYAAARENFPQFPMFYQMADKNASATVRQQYPDGRFEGCAMFFDLQIALKKKKDDATALFAKTLSEISPPKSEELMIGTIPIVRQNVDNIVQLIQSYVNKMDNVFTGKTISCESIDSIGETVMVPLADALKNIILGDKNGNERTPNYSSTILSVAIEHMFNDGILNTDCVLAPRKPPYIASTSNNLSKNNPYLRNLQQQISRILISEKKSFPQNSNSNINSIEIPSLDNDAGEQAGEPPMEVGASASVFLSPSSYEKAGGGIMQAEGSLAAAPTVSVFKSAAAPRIITTSIQQPSAGGGGSATLYDQDSLNTFFIPKLREIQKKIGAFTKGSQKKNEIIQSILEAQKMLSEKSMGGAKTRKRKPRKTRKRGKRGMRKTRKGAIE